MARILGVSNFNEITTVHALVSYIRFMSKEMNIPLSVSEISGIREDEYMARVEAMAEAALSDACTATNPRVPTKQEIIEIYKSIW